MSDATPLSSDYMAALADVERRFPVDQWRASEVALWPMLRVRWMFDEFARQTGQASSQPAKSRMRGIMGRCLGTARAYFELARDALTYASGRDRGPTRRNLVFLSDGLSFARLDAAWLERFCDPIIARARLRGISSALWTPLYTTRRPRASATRFLQPRIDLATLLALTLRRYRESDVELPQHAEVVAALAQRGFGTGSLERSKIVRYASRLRSIAAFYRRQLARARPSLAFIVSYYSLEGIAFVLACHQLSICVVELQHGVQGELHPAYAAWPSPPEGRHELIPDIFWVWSASEANVIERWARGTRHSALAAGNPWLDVWRSDSIWPGLENLHRAARTLKVAARGQPVVLVTLQFGLPESAQIEPLARLIELAADKLSFWVRLHPMMLAEREKVRRLLGNVGMHEIDQPTDLPLHALLPNVNVHLTHSSSTVIEAAQCGVRSVITNAWGVELFTSQIEAGWAVAEVGSPDRVLDACLRLAATRATTDTVSGDIDAALDQVLAVVRP